MDPVAAAGAPARSSPATTAAVAVLAGRRGAGPAPPAATSWYALFPTSGVHPRDDRERDGLGDQRQSDDQPGQGLGAHHPRGQPRNADGAAGGGFHLYTEADVERLALVKSMKPLDFPPDQIRDLVELITALSAQPPPGAAATEDMRKRLGMYRAATDSRIESLRAQLHGLEALSQNLRSLANTAARRRGSTQRR